MSGHRDRPEVSLLAARLAALEEEQQRLLALLRALLPALRQRGGPGAAAPLPDPAGGAAGSAAHREEAASARRLEILIDEGEGLRINAGGTSLQIGSPDGGTYISSRRGPGLYVETTGTAAVVASSISGPGLHAAGGGVRGGLDASPGTCGVFTEGGSGDGLYATSDATALHGVSPTGYGACLDGGTAPLRLVPSAARGGAHLAGSLRVDGTGRLWLCVADGTPGDWRRVALEDGECAMGR